MAFFVQVLVEARYRFKVGVLSFQNPSNTDSNGQNCDIGFDTVCEYTFRFCLSLPGNINCVLGSTVTGSSYITGSPYTFTLGQPLIPGTTIPNPIVYTDAISSGNQWPVSFYLYLIGPYKCSFRVCQVYYNYVQRLKDNVLASFLATAQSQHTDSIDEDHCIV